MDEFESGLGPEANYCPFIAFYIRHGKRMPCRQRVTDGHAVLLESARNAFLKNKLFR
jgi:hypothetical protein